MSAWEWSVEADPNTTPAYRAWVREMRADAEAALAEGATAYEVMILSVAPVFAAEDEETVEIVMRPDDTAEVGE